MGQGPGGEEREDEHECDVTDQGGRETKPTGEDVTDEGGRGLRTTTTTHGHAREEATDHEEGLDDEGAVDEISIHDDLRLVLVVGREVSEGRECTQLQYALVDGHVREKHEQGEDATEAIDPGIGETGGGHREERSEVAEEGETLKQADGSSGVAGGGGAGRPQLCHRADDDHHQHRAQH